MWRARPVVSQFGDQEDVHSGVDKTIRIIMYCIRNNLDTRGVASRTNVVAIGETERWVRSGVTESETSVII